MHKALLATIPISMISILNSFINTELNEKGKILCPSALYLSMPTQMNIRCDNPIAKGLLKTPILTDHKLNKEYLENLTQDLQESLSIDAVKLGLFTEELVSLQPAQYYSINNAEETMMGYASVQNYFNSQGEPQFLVTIRFNLQGQIVLISVRQSNPKIR